MKHGEKSLPKIFQHLKHLAWNMERKEFSNWNCTVTLGHETWGKKSPQNFQAPETYGLKHEEERILRFSRSETSPLKHEEERIFKLKLHWNIGTWSMGKKSPKILQYLKYLPWNMRGKEFSNWDCTETLGHETWGKSPQQFCSTWNFWPETWLGWLDLNWNIET